MQRAADEVRARYAALIGASADEVAFLYSTSEGENIVARGLAHLRGARCTQASAGPETRLSERGALPPERFNWLGRAGSPATPRTGLNAPAL
jgi:hypothetical protein